MTKSQKRVEPTFGFIGRDANERLYQLESKVADAVRQLADHRSEAYNEDLWKCAIPEALHAMLDAFQPDHVKLAVLHWLRVQIFPEQHHRIAGIARDEDLERQLCNILMERSGAKT